MHLDPSWIQIGAAIGVIYVVGRWALSSKEPEVTNRPARTVPQEQIEAVLAAFPQVTENQARFDLGRSGSLETTIERLLRDGRLPDPPPGLFSATGNAVRTTSASTQVSRSAPTGQPNLITKYNLQSRIEESEDIKGKGKEQETVPKWSVDSGDREAGLRERKARMILDARRKLIEKDRLSANS